MTSTARRRWSRELESEVDGIAIMALGPILFHGYDPPPGGKWLDDVIPGKLGALDRNTGDVLWVAPCEVGYGRGFAAGFGASGQALVLGPSTHGHRLVRMSLEDGELLEGGDIPPFDEAHVASDYCHCASAQRVFAVDSTSVTEVWEYRREGERYHSIERHGSVVFVVYSQLETRLQGILALDAQTGKYEGQILGASLRIIHEIAVTGEVLIALTGDIERIIPPERLGEYTVGLASHPGGGPRATLSMLGFHTGGGQGDSPLWYRVLETTPMDALPDASISADSGKLYAERGAFLDAIDALSGRPLGQWTIPGLDQRVCWQVATGGGLLAEETRVSLFELPA